MKIKTQRKLAVVYVRETRSLMQREENLQRGFENRVVRDRCVPKKDKVPGDWRKLNNEKARSLYSTPNNIRVIKFRRLRSVRHLARMGRRYMHTDYWRSSLKERKNPIGRSTKSSKITKCVLHRIGEQTQDLSGSG